MNHRMGLTAFACLVFLGVAGCDDVQVEDETAEQLEESDIDAQERKWECSDDVCCTGCGGWPDTCICCWWSGSEWLC